MIRLENLNKNYGKCDVLKNLDFCFLRGKIYGIIGKNGVGKTTLLKHIAGLAKASNGSVIREAKYIGCSFGSDYYDELSIEKNLILRKSSLGLADDETTVSFLTDVGLWQNRKKPLKHLSLGMTQMVDLALAMLGNPDLLILDEPFNGLDPMNIITARKYLLDYMRKYNALIIISSHDLSGLSRLVTDFVMLSDGKIIEHIEKSEIDTAETLEALFQNKLLKEAE